MQQEICPQDILKQGIALIEHLQIHSSIHHEYEYQILS